MLIPCIVSQSFSSIALYQRKHKQQMVQIWNKYQIFLWKQNWVDSSNTSKRLVCNGSIKNRSTHHKLLYLYNTYNLFTSLINFITSRDIFLSTLSQEKTFTANKEPVHEETLLYPDSGANYEKKIYDCTSCDR